MEPRSDLRRLTPHARRGLADVDVGKARAFLPAIVAIEFASLREAGRPLITALDIEAATKRNQEVRVLPLDLAQVEEFALLVALSDPFDRAIVAAARSTGRPLVTADTKIHDSSGLVDVIWD